MRLTELLPQWFGAGGEGIYKRTGARCPKCRGGDSSCRTCFGGGEELIPAPQRTGVGVSFLCPCAACSAQRTGDPDKDFHLRVFIEFRNPIDGGPALESTGPKWQRTGETFEELRLSPSILSDPMKGGCGWHGYVGLNVSGEVTSC